MAHRIVDLLNALEEGAIVRRKKWNPSTFIIKDGNKYVYEDGFVVRDFPDLYADDWEIYDITGRIPVEECLIARGKDIFTTSYRKPKSEILVPRPFRGEPVKSSLAGLAIEYYPKCNPVLDFFYRLLGRVFGPVRSIYKK